MMTTTKPIYQSRTIWLNLLTALVAVLALPEIQALAGADALQYLVIAQAIANVLMRLMTSQPVTWSR